MNRTIYLLSFFFLLIPFLLSAQDTTANLLDEVIVTANKFEQKQSATGKVISVIDKGQIERSAGKTLSQLLNEQAGLVINGALNNRGSVQSVYMRGAASGRTLILVDGIPVTDPSMIGNEFDLNLLSLTGVERIEICRGAQSTLYGSDAVAGVINIITQKNANATPLQSNTLLGAGNYGSYKGAAQLYGNIGKLSYSARYAKDYTNGFSSAKDTGSQYYDRDGYNSNITGASLGFAATDKLKLNTSVQYSRYKTGADAGAFADDKDFTIRNNGFMSRTGFSYKSQAFSLSGNYQYNEMTRSYRNDSADIPSYIVFDKNEYFSKTHYAELYASIPLGGGFTLLQGADVRYGSMHSLSYSKSYFAPDYYEFTSAFPDTSVSQTSVYSSLQYSSANGRFNAELGGRLNRHSRYGTNYTYTFNPSYKMGEKVRLFGSVASGFKAPTLYQLFSPYGKADLQPETSVNAEAGLQWQEKKWNVRAVYFYRHIRSGLDFDNMQYVYFNNVRQIVRGIETELSFRPANGWQLSANYTYLSAGETTQQRIAFDKDTTYRYLLRRPKHSLNATASYQFTEHFFASLSGKYVSPRYDAAGYAQPDVRLGSYVLLSAYTAYSFTQHVKLFANVQNLLNQSFYEVYGFTAQPFTFLAGVQLSF